MTPNRIKLTRSVTLEPDVAEGLGNICKDTDRSFNYTLNRLLRLAVRVWYLVHPRT